MNGKLRFILVVSLGVALLASGIGVTRSSFVDPGSSTGNAFQAWASTSWVQTSRADFEAGVLNQVDTSSSPGNVMLGSVYGEPTTSVGPEESWYYPSWSRRAPVTINNSGSGLTDYQVRVDVTYDADMQPDFDDIRFIDSDDSTELSHWRESYTASASATFWVKVPSIPSSSKTIYLYYGNAAAGSASDGNATFDFFDDFDDHAAGEVPDGWTVHSGCSGIVVQDDAGNKVLGDGTGSGGNVTAGNPSWTDIACRQRFRSVDDVVYHAGVVIRYTDEGNEVYGGIVLDTAAEIWNRAGGTWTQIGGTWTIPDVGTGWHVQELRIDGGTVELYIDDEYIGSGTLTGGAPTSGACGFWCQYGQQGYRDEHIVRQYVSPEPTTSVGSEDGWSRRAPVTISNSGSALTDFQVRVDVTYDADMQPDFDDIRFMDSDGSTPLSHWREDYTASDSATFWVKVPSVPSGDKTIYLYYGYDAASSASDGDATFIFFDDFSGDLSQWNIHIDTDVAITSSYGNPAPSLEISGGVTGSPYGFAAIGSDATYTGFQDGIIEADIYPATVALPEIIFRGDYSANTGYKGRWDCRSGTESPWMKPPYSGWSAFGTAVARFGIANQWQKAKLVITGSTFMIYSNDNLKSTVDNTQYSGPGEIGLANHYGTYARFDNVRVRKCAWQQTYVSTGTVASRVLNTGANGARWDALFWDETLTGDTDITFKVRASNTPFAKGAASPPWIPVGGDSPVISGLPSGRYMQWQATLTTSDPSQTPTLYEVRVYYSDY